MDLLGYIKTGEDLSRLPNGMHTVLPAAPERGLEAGVIFTLRNRNQGINVNQQNRLHPYYIVYINHAGKVLVNHTEPKRMLDLIRSACKGRDKPLPAAYAPFNRATADGRDMDAHSKLLQQAIQSMIEVKEDQDIDSLFTGTRTTALLNTISGLEDFELIAFVVVQNPN
jgi:hypothetical protein